MYDIHGNLINIEVGRIIEQLDDDWSVTGYIDGNPLNSFTLSYSDGKMLSSIRNISTHSFMEISYRSENDSHFLLEIDPHKTDKLSCGIDHSSKLMQRRTSKEAANHHLPETNETTVIDVMVVYTPAAEAWAFSGDAGGIGIQNVINQAMAVAQNAVDNSNINLEFRLVHTAKVDYRESFDGSEADLENLTFGKIPNVHEWRDQYNADLVAMFTDVEDTGGLAWVANSNIHDADYAFSITRVQQAANTTTHVHEMGHNMGNSHSRNQRVEPAGESGGIFEYSTGWRWIGNNDVGYVSVMTYEERPEKDIEGNPIYDIEVNIFSNPDISFQGVPTGSYTGPYAPADAARSMRERKRIVSLYRVADQEPGDQDEDDEGDDKDDEGDNGVIIDPTVKPENLQLEYDSGTVTINWSPVESIHLTGYNIYRSRSSSNLQFYESISSNSTSFQDNPTETMFYSVRAAYGSNIESSLSNIVGFYKIEKNIGPEWELISIPLLNGLSGQSQFIGFNQIYSSENSILPGRGYWVRSDTDGTVNTEGVGLVNVEIKLERGWNLIGGLADRIPINNISDPQNILSNAPIYGYFDREYSTVSGFISAGRGYWIHANESGTIQLFIEGTQPAHIHNSSLITTTNSDLHQLEFNSLGRIQNFWISENDFHSDDLIQYLLPPKAPGGILDVRSNYNLSITDQPSTNIYLTAEQYPVSVNYYPNEDILADYTYRLVGIKGENEIHMYLNGQAIEIPYHMDSLVLERVKSNELITEFKMHSNYPNPFNPVTNIRYELPQQSPVRIEIFDVAGRRVALLVDDTQQPGSYTVQFDGSGIASGLYLVRFNAGSFNQAMPITFIK